jgi:hypothetical protein
MALGAFPFFLALLSFGRSGQAAAEKAPKHKPPHAVVPTPVEPLPPVAEWPQVVPAGLPAFPGKGWVPDVPLSSGVRARAVALRPVLWARGVGAHKTEQTAGRWITYLAKLHGGKQAVEAYRLASEVPVQPVPASTAPTPVAPKPAPAKPAPAAAKPVPAPTPAPATPVATTVTPANADRQRVAAALAKGLAGVAKGKENKGLVTAYQRMIGAKDDGMYGPTVGHALAADGVVPPSPLYWPKNWNQANKAIKDWKAFAAQQAALETNETRRLAWEESARGARMSPTTPYTAQNLQQAAAIFFQ